MKYFIRYGKQEGPSSFQRNILDTLVAQDKAESVKWADVLRDMGYWTYVFDEKEYVEQFIEGLELLCKNFTLDTAYINDSITLEKVNNINFWRYKRDLT